MQEVEKQFALPVLIHPVKFGGEFCGMDCGCAWRHNRRGARSSFAACLLCDRGVPVAPRIVRRFAITAVCPAFWGRAW